MTEQKGYRIREQYGLYFVTLTIVGWIDIFTRKECKSIFIESLKFCVENKGLQLYAFVIMPSHVHLIVKGHEKSKGLSSILRDLKRHASKGILKFVLNSNSESRREWLKVVFKYHAKFNKNNSVYQVWKQDNRPMILEQPKFTLQKLNYIHNNPVADGTVSLPEHYLYSSARNYSNMLDTIIDVIVIDFGVTDGYVMT